MNITFTGVDSQTDLDSLWRSIESYRFHIEIGVLYTKNPDGRNRYPNYNRVLETLVDIPNSSLHICGKKAREQLINGELAELVGCANRVQVNGVLTLDEVESICAANKETEIITQHTAANTHLLAVKSVNHSILIDGSGGQGKSPESWIVPETDKKVGFAGGLGEDNIITELSKINKLSKDGYWIDMEGKLRINDWFDIDKVRNILILLREEVT